MIFANHFETAPFSCMSKKPRRVRRPKAAKKVKSFSTGVCTWDEICQGGFLHETRNSEYREQEKVFSQQKHPKQCVWDAFLCPVTFRSVAYSVEFVCHHASSSLPGNGLRVFLKFSHFRIIATIGVVICAALEAHCPLYP